MDQTLKDLLKEKLDGLPAGDAAPGFDREETWAALAGRLDAPKRRIVPLRPHWGYAAAALLAGLLLGGPLLRYLRPDAAPAPTVVVKKTAGTAPATAPVFPASPAPGRTGAGEAEPPTARPAPGIRPASGNRMVANPVPQTVARTADPAPAVVVPAPAGATPVPAARGTRRAVHLLDLQTEDRTVLLERESPVRPAAGFTLYLSPKRLPDGRDDAAPASVIRPLLQ